MKIVRRILLILLILIIVTASFMLIIGFGYYSNALKEKPLTVRVDEIVNKEHFTSYDNLPKDYINAVIAVEDHRYYDHGPIDIISIGRAIFTNIRNKEFDEGGSTITQQVSKNVIFNQDKSLTRKLGELFGSYDLEKNYTKQEILALYANSSYFGDGYYCIYDASMGYYEKEPKDLTLAECAMLAGVPNAPSLYSPTVNMDLATKRQHHVLDKMVQYGYISTKEATDAK